MFARSVKSLAFQFVLSTVILSLVAIGCSKRASRKENAAVPEKNAIELMSSSQTLKFNDANLEQCVKSTKVTINSSEGSKSVFVDQNADGELSLSEAQMITSLNCSAEAIRNLSGIEHLKNLEYLNCSANELGVMPDFSSLTNLKTLRCVNNYFSDADCTELQRLRSMGLEKLEIEKQRDGRNLTCDQIQLVAKISPRKIKPVINPFSGTLVTESPNNDVWGFIHGDEQYAVYGDYEKIFIVKILEQEPYVERIATMSRGEEVEFTKTTKNADGSMTETVQKKVPNHSIWGEYRYYSKNGKAYLYASSEGAIHSIGENRDNPNLFPYLQIFDITDVKNPKEIKIENIHEGLRSIHNITLDTDRGILMAFGGTDHQTGIRLREENRKLGKEEKKKIRNQWKGARLYSLEDPTKPKYIMTVGDTYVHDGQVKTTLDEKGTVLSTRVYLAQGSSAIHWDASKHTAEDNKIGIYDVTDMDPTKIKVLLRKQYPYGYAHNIWATADDKNIVVTGETSVDNQLSFWRLDEKGDGTLEAEFINGLNLQGGSLAHNAFVDGNHIYLAHYTKGVQVAEIFENSLGKKDLRLVWAYDTYPKDNSGDMRGSWGVYPFGRSDRMFFATDSRTGFYVFKKLDRFMSTQVRD